MNFLKALSLAGQRLATFLLVAAGRPRGTSAQSSPIFDLRLWNPALGGATANAGTVEKPKAPSANQATPFSTSTEQFHFDPARRTGRMHFRPPASNTTADFPSNFNDPSLVPYRDNMVRTQDTGHGCAAKNPVAEGGFRSVGVLRYNETQSGATSEAQAQNGLLSIPDTVRSGFNVNQKAIVVFIPTLPPARPPLKCAISTLVFARGFPGGISGEKPFKWHSQWRLGCIRGAKMVVAAKEI
jgi:hypothetical protein